MLSQWCCLPVIPRGEAKCSLNAQQPILNKDSVQASVNSHVIQLLLKQRHVWTGRAWMGKGVSKAVENINQHLGPALKVQRIRLCLFMRLPLQCFSKVSLIGSRCKQRHK